MTQHPNLMSKVSRLPAALLLALGLSLAACGDGGAKAPEPDKKAEAAEPAKPAETIADDPANANPIPGVALDDMVQGSVDAPVTVIEFASMTCSHCAHFHKETFPLLKRDFVDTGTIRFIFREFALNVYDVDAATLARCAGAACSRQLSGRRGQSIQHPRCGANSAGMRKPSAAGVESSGDFMAAFYCGRSLIWGRRAKRGHSTSVA